MLVERREELLATRAAILEDRQAALAQRQIQIEESNEQLEAIRNNLLDYEQTLADALRSLIRKSAEWEIMSPSQAQNVLEAQPTPEPEPELDVPPEPAPETHIEAEDPVQTEEVSAPPEPETTEVSPRKQDAFDITFVEAAPETNEPPQPAAEDVNFISPHSPAEDAATESRIDEAPEEEGDFPITLEIDLTSQEGHSFFRYEDDDPDELPGLFLATSRRLKEGREVILEMLVTTDGRVNTKGVVSWSQKEEDGEGPNGMGIDIVDLTPADMALVRIWLETHQMMMV